MSTNLIKYSKNSTHDFSPFLVLFEKLNSFRFFFFTSTSSINEESVEQTSSSMEIAFLDSTCTSWVAEGRFVASKVPSDAEAFGLRNSSKLISWVKDRTKAFVVGFTLMFDWLADFEWFDVGLTDGSFGSKSSGNDLWKNVCRILNIIKIKYSNSRSANLKREILIFRFVGIFVLFPVFASWGLVFV